MDRQAPQRVEARRNVCLRVENAGFFYGTTQVLRSVSFQISESEVVALVGRSGAGKSTLLKCIAGLAALHEGKIEKMGRGRVAMLFQDALLQPWLTARESVETPGRIGHFKVKACELLESVGLKGRENAYPRELSGGMKRRVALARALAQEPDILLLDEPYTGLDEITASRLYELLASIVAERRIGVLLVTHSVHEAVRIASRVLVLSGNPASVRREFDPGSMQSQSRHLIEEQIRMELQAESEFVN